MARESINRSISLDPELFDKMEARRAALMLSRSAYVQRCIANDVIEGGSMMVKEMPKSIVANPVTSRPVADDDRRRKTRSTKAKSK